MPFSSYLTVTIIACVIMLIAGIYRPLRTRFSRNSRRPFKPYLFYPLFLGALAALLTTPAIINLHALINPGAAFTLEYMGAGALTGLLAGGLYVLGYEGKAPYKPEALLILPLLGAFICIAFSYAANL